ncbi:MAG: 1,6-anhydro-N-acetylmuramyl-L-alanine amidase AmpD [Gammaproteobacteria bacterium]|nr:1,6-anhydro-N-acetylmuramyl-L-alanine amidase AmpD [Gammaproteobacteria bacterium]
MNAATFEHGWLRGARHRPSPHCDARPAAASVELVVIHAISLPPGQFGTGCVEDLFLGRLDHAAHAYFDGLRALRVSAHFLIGRDGALTQFVSCAARAWHAGRSCWQGREACNDFSVGIELEGCDALAFTDGQYATLGALLATLRAHYPVLDGDRVVGHSDIAPGRKSDPGPCFDWARLRAALAR